MTRPMGVMMPVAVACAEGTRTSSVSRMSLGGGGSGSRSGRLAAGGVAAGRRARGVRLGAPLVGLGAAAAAADEAFGEKDMCRNQVNERRVVDPSSSSAEKVKVTFLGAGGAEQVIDCPADTYILDAAVEEGIDLPWSCKGGICGCCVGRVASGAVDMSDVDDISFVLEEEDVAKGMSLLCMARPVAGQDLVIETQCDWGYLLGMQEWKGATGNVNNVVGDAWKPQETHKPL